MQEGTVYGCPMQTSGRDALELLRAYRTFERGCMPAPGAWREQAGAFADWVAVIEGERGMIEEKRAEEAKRN